MNAVCSSDLPRFNFDGSEILRSLCLTSNLASQAFDVAKKLGHGAYGIVYKARSRFLKEYVALKAVCSESSRIFHLPFGFPAYRDA